MEKTQNKHLTLGSLFSGSGGFELGGIISGIKPVWNSEIEPFAVRVTTKRLPGVKHYGDVSSLNGAELEPVDIITFGSPCQDMSIAGKRAGLDGERSGLFHEAIRIIKEMRCRTDGKYPRYCVWENVPGAFTSNKGEDFKAVLEAVCSVKSGETDLPRPEKWPSAGEIVADNFSVAWRVFDAQYWGVPQRRSRIYLVADFDGGSAGKILFESEGVSGYTPQGFRSWQGAAGSAEESTGATGICLNDQGGERMDVTDGVTSTLRAEAHHPPVVTEAAGFCTEHSKDSRGIGYEEETAPTLRAGTVPAAVYENHGQDTRFTGPLEVAPTVLSTYGTGGNNQPFVVEDKPKTFDVRLTSEGTRNARSNVYETDTSRTIDTGGNSPDANQGGVAICEPKSYGIGKPAFTSGEKAGFNFAVNEEVSPTLQASGPDAVAQPEQKAYGICGKYSHSMMSDNPNSGFYEADTARTIDTSNQCPAKNQGGVVVVEGNGSRPSHKGDGYSESETMYTLNTIEQHAVAFADTHASLSANDGPKGPSSQMLSNPEENFVSEVAYGIDRASYNMGKNAKFAMVIEEEVEPAMVARGAGAVGQPVYHSSKNSYHTHFSDSGATDTLVATDYKDPPTVIEEPYYIVRRLTPTECARLQGFPDWWCRGLETENPTDEDISFWTEVFETHRKVMGTSSKPKTRAQIVKWLKDPHSDSAEYKLWGNGVSLPIVHYVLAGIAYYSQVKELYTP